MAIIVQKFGGTSIATTTRINEVSQIIRKTIQSGDLPVIVVSAMAGVTNNLVSMCLEVSSLHDETNSLAEYDAALSSGEIVTAALLALSLQNLNIKAQSVSGWQIPIYTNAHHSKALVTHIETQKLLTMLENGIIPIISGFQGVNHDGRITTLGRGGSDTTAAAIAGALRAERCDIYTDTDGVYTADPRLVPNSSLIPTLNYSEMLEFAKLGAKILHPRAVQIAKRHNTPIQILSSFTCNAGTIIRNNKVDKMEQPHITGVAYSNDLALCTVQCPSTNHMLLLQKLTAQNIHIGHMQYSTLNNNGIVTFSIPLLQLKTVMNIAPQLQYKIVESTANITQIAVVGIGLNNDCKSLHTMLEILQKHDVTPRALETSTTSISCIINNENYEKIIKDLHDALIQ